MTDQVQQAQQRLQHAIHEHSDDLTGQDGEDEINEAADDLIAARNDKFRRNDPDGYAERKAMGLL